jgi:hypothetical protein
MNTCKILVTLLICYPKLLMYLIHKKIALRYAQDNLGVKKVEAPSNCPIMSFAR